MATIVQNDGDHISVSFGRSYSDVARKFNVCGQSTTNMWKKFVDSREIGLLDKEAQNSPNLTRTELKIIEIFKQDSRSMLLSKICDVQILITPFPVELQRLQ